jgi:hypothetical protein
LTTSLDYALRRPEFAPALRAYLRALDLSDES